MAATGHAAPHRSVRQGTAGPTACRCPRTSLCPVCALGRRCRAWLCMDGSGGRPAPQTGPSCWSGLAVPWVCPGCKSLVVNPPPPCPAQQVAAGWGTPEAGAPRAGAGEDLGGPLGGGGWENPLQAPACVEATEAQGFLPPAEQGGAGPAPPIPRPQAAVSLQGRFVSTPLPAFLVCAKRMHRSGSRWCGAHEEGGRVGVHTGSNLSPPQGAGAQASQGTSRTSGSSSGHWRLEGPRSEPGRVGGLSPTRG